MLHRTHDFNPAARRKVLPPQHPLPQECDTNSQPPWLEVVQAMLHAREEARPDERAYDMRLQSARQPVVVPLSRRKDVVALYKPHQRRRPHNPRQPAAHAQLMQALSPFPVPRPCLGDLPI